MPKGTASLGHTLEKDRNEIKEEDCSESILRQIPVECRKECVTFVCPVCEKSVSKPHLPDVESVVRNGLYFVGYARIITSKAVLKHEFVHYYDEEEDSGLEELHTVTAVISTEFDGKGDCTVFDILEICPCDTKDFVKEKLMEVEGG